MKSDLSNLLVFQGLICYFIYDMICISPMQKAAIKFFAAVLQQGFEFFNQSCQNPIIFQINLFRSFLVSKNWSLSISAVHQSYTYRKPFRFVYLRLNFLKIPKSTGCTHLYFRWQLDFIVLNRFYRVFCYDFFRTSSQITKMINKIITNFYKGDRNVTLYRNTMTDC